jgi:hypothetical protein
MARTADVVCLAANEQVRLRIKKVDDAVPKQRMLF